MTIKDLKKLIQTDSYRWLIICAKPFMKLIIGLILIDAVSAVISVGSVVVSKHMVDNTIAGNAKEAISFILIFVGIQAVTLAMSVFSSKISVQISEKMSYSLEKDTIKRIYNKDWMALNGFHSGDILTRLTYDTGSVVSLWLSTFPGMVTLGFQLVAAFVILAIYDLTLALLAFALGPIAIILSYIVGQKKRKVQREIHAAESRYRSYITELLHHILIIKSFQYEDESLKHVSERQEDKYKCVIKKNNISITNRLVVSGGYYLGYILAFVYGVSKIATGTSFGTFTAFLQLVGQVQSPVIGLTKSFSHMISSLASVERLVELESLEDETEKLPVKLNKKMNARLYMQGVTFGYIPDKIVLKDSSFEAEPGKITALIGSSGEGKTTIMRLLLGLIKPAKGKIYLNLDKSEEIPVTSGTRGYFTYVPQGNTLFSGTIAENLRVGKPDAFDYELEEALKAACIWDFVQTLPDRINTVLGESNTGISEGQAQRLCIARALLRPSPILLLDEATSALDMETEKKIFENIKQMKAKTCIAITHRLSVLPLCDTIYRLENGRLFKHKSKDFTDILVSEINHNDEK
ncbi:MAG: ABC transporter ATP-binding protein [Acetivibrionales bacterium]|jgi:ATP-binding cassette subfamily B protein